MGPTPDQGDALVGILWRPALEDVVDVARVALQKARKATEELLHKVLVVLFGVREQHVVAVGDGGEEVALLARLPEPILALLRMDHGGCRIRRDHGSAAQRFLPHRMTDGRTETAARLCYIAAHRAAVELDSLILDMLLEPVVRH